jgi:hypothetical protein
MAKKNDQEKRGELGGAALGGSGAVGAISGMSQTDRVAQIQAMQATSPFATVSGELKINVDKDFNLEKEQFDYRTNAMKNMSNTIDHSKKREKQKMLGQHVESITFADEKGFEKPLHKFFGEVNVELFSPKQVLTRQGGYYVDSEKFKPPKKGVVE